jgi:stearoyl-CoA desaturase (delta-9 desaturase)
MNQSPPAKESLVKRIKEWAFSSNSVQAGDGAEAMVIDWVKAIPYALIHVACLGVIWVGWSWPALAMALFFYALRVFALTGFYHRYFAHRSFKVGRITQFVFGWIGCTAIQKSPLWWAAHHRHHHAHSDDEHDLHSPKQSGFWYAHMGWFLTPKCGPTNYRLIPDFAKFPEMRWLDRFELIPPLVLIGLLYLTGFVFAYQWPELGCTGAQMVIWFFISTVAVYQVTYLVNTATHMFGTRRYVTKDDSRNSLIIALLTFGEGWHNNHHYYPNSTRQGFFWWEIDITYYGLCFLQMFGLVWEVRPVPKRLLYPKPKTVPTAMPAPAAQ